MGSVGLGVNLEFARHDDKPFEWAVEKAAELGYAYVEPMLHWGRELLSEAGYFHSVSMLDDPLRITRACKRAGVKLSAVSAHSPLCKPEISTESQMGTKKMGQRVPRGAETARLSSGELGEEHVVCGALFFSNLASKGVLGVCSRSLS
ncbi:MAG TPA: hypothetical protein PLM33_01055 [Acidobacteriota bacterium]|nr:hypothetical protein [Acidobacteriota bacterium]HRR26027.1 hypothetical protein [Acidobacteriota bacterium]